MSSHILKIGRTNYYSVRKGQQQYCIAEGRRVQDLDHCWLVLRDPNSGRNFFVNRSGVRRWHLPDIFQTDRERQEEERALKFRRQQKQEELRRLEAGGRGREEDDDDDEENKAEETEKAGESEALKGVINYKELFAARDAAARQLPLLRGWETPSDRKPVTRFAKTILSPFYHQGTITKEALAALILTGTREFCAKHGALGPAEKAEFAKDLQSLVQARVEEDTRRNEFQKMNEDLLDRLKRLDAERKEQAAKLNENAKVEEDMKQELFRLRAHKQETLVQSFKRLTKKGLVEAYWERWTRYKSIVEAQNHVNARERRTKEMAEKIKDLEVVLNQKGQEVEELRLAHQQRQAKEVINRILGQLGRDVQQRFFVKWLKFAMERKRDKDLYNLRLELVNCSRCAQRHVDMERVSNSALEAWQATHELQRQAAESYESAQRNDLIAAYWRAMADFGIMVAANARAIANLQHHTYAARELHFKVQEQKVKELTKEVDGLRFEVSVGVGGGRIQNPEDFENSLGDTASSLTMGAQSGYGVGSGQSVNGHRPGASRHVRPADDQQLTSFFVNDANASISKLERRIGSRPDAGLPPPSSGVMYGGPRGLVDSVTQSSIAPNVFNSIRPNDSKAMGNHHTATPGLKPDGGKYYEPVIINAASKKTFESAFDQRTKEIMLKNTSNGPEGGNMSGKRVVIKDNKRSDSSSSSNSSSSTSSSSSSSSESSSSGKTSSKVSPKSSTGQKQKNGTIDAGNDKMASPGSQRLQQTLAIVSGASPPPPTAPPATEPISRYLAEKEARKQQAAVLQFIKPPMTAEEIAEKRAKAQLEAFETAEEKEAKRCPKCGFRYDSAAFCPKDGSRHTYRSLQLKAPVQMEQDSNPPDSVARLIATQNAVTPAPLQTHKDDPMRVLVLPEYNAAATKRLSNLEAPQYLRQPPGMVPLNDDGTVPDPGRPPSPPHPLVQKHTHLLRSSLNLDPTSYRQPRVYTLGGDRKEYLVAADVQHPKELVDAQNALEQEALYRETIDNVRFTRIMTESTRRIADRANIHSMAAEERQRSYAERSIIAGYNPSADPDSALSLESRLFTGKQQTRNLDRDNLDVPNYFTATRGFATRSGAFQSSGVVPTMVSEKMNTIASDRYYSSANEGGKEPISENERVQRNILRYNDPHRSTAELPVNVPVTRGAGGFQPGVQQSRSNVGNQSAPSRTSWSNVFQYNDVLYDKGLGLHTADDSGTFGTIKESQKTKATNPQLLSAQLQSTPNFSRGQK